MATITTSTARTSRPATVTAAVALTAFSTIGSLPLLFAPGADEIPGAVVVFGLVAGIASLAGAWGMWNLRRWGAILVFILTLLNTLSALPGLIDPPSGWLLAAILIGVPIGVATLVLVAHPASRRAYR